MASTSVLIVLLLIATVTDLRWRLIYNETTYPGIVLALACNGLATLVGLEPESSVNSWLGLVGFGDSLAGLASCGCLMLTCYVFFPGGVGGGDVKLLAMMGAVLGLVRGLEALLWTFVLGGGLAAIMLVWQFGAWKLLFRTIQVLAFTLRFRTLGPLSDEERQRLKTDLHLTPSALAAVLIVQFQVVRWF